MEALHSCRTGDGGRLGASGSRTITGRLSCVRAFSRGLARCVERKAAAALGQSSAHGAVNVLWKRARASRVWVEGCRVGIGFGGRDRARAG